MTKIEKARREEIKEIKSRYPIGTMVRCLRTINDDVQTDDVGEVKHIDDEGIILVNWQNGTTLGISEQEDDFEILRYSIEGYDKDNDAYFVLGYFSCWSIALTTASDLSKKLSMLYNPDKHEPIDWLVVKDLLSNEIIAHSDISNRIKTDYKFIKQGE